MRDADAQRVVRETAEAAVELNKILLAARRRIRDWKSEGYPSGAGESSIGSDRHSDPTARAVIAAEVVNKKTQRHVGFRDIDPAAERLARIDRALIGARDTIMSLVAELTDVVDEPGEPTVGGCELCDELRLPFDAKGNPLHQCDAACVEREHHHPDAYQPICSRKAPIIDDDIELPDRARCQFHYEFAKRYAEDAEPAITHWHLEHLATRVPLTLVRQHHSAAFERYHGQRRTA